MEHNGHRARLKERFLKDDLEGFAPHEALELLLTFALPRCDTNPLAHRLIDHFGSLHGVLEAPASELALVKGIGQNAAVLLHLVLPMLRLYEKDRQVKRLTLTNFSQLEAYCQSLLKGMITERFYVLCFDARLTLISSQLIAEGTLNEVAVYPRLVLATLLRLNATGAVLCHNHPGGTETPSEEDIELTGLVGSLLAGVGIRLYDHVLVAGDKTFSMNTHHLLEGQTVNESAQKPVLADKPRLTSKQKHT